MVYPHYNNRSRESDNYKYKEIKQEVLHLVMLQIKNNIIHLIDKVYWLTREGYSAVFPLSYKPIDIIVTGIFTKKKGESINIFDESSLPYISSSLCSS